MCERCWKGGLDGRGERGEEEGRERRWFCVGSEWGGGRAGTWTGCHFNNLGLELAGLLMSRLFCNHLVSASAVPRGLNSFVLEFVLVR